ncbi:putative internal virion protein B [Klebsiella phage vB_KpP-Screen]|nr:putative internal virion protein B [Klebsiella phage vB_KpP-Screen]CAD5239133.1 putative internal virion protein B [Klebsiella phage vB_KqP-Goliath]CAD5239686.1 putative internal virion protein B [Klebsiella phage vB_KpP-Yoda]
MSMWWAAAALAGSKLLGTGAQIEVSKARNKAVIQQTAKQLNDIALQRAQSRDRTEVALFNIQQQKLQAQSQVGLQAAASGTMGASVKDAVATVSTVADRQESGIRAQQTTQEEGYRMMVDKAVDSGLANMDLESGYDKMFNAALSFGGQLLGQYVGDKLSESGGSEGPSKGTSEGGTATKNAGAAYDLWGSKGNSKVHTW